MSALSRSCGVIAIVVGLVAGGCGSPSLSGDEKARVAGYRQAFLTTAIDGERYGTTLRGVDYLIALCHAKASARVDGDVTVKQTLEDAANDLRDAQPDLAAKLDHVVAAGC